MNAARLSARSWTHMQTISELNPTTAQLRRQIRTVTEAIALRADSAWKPKPCGLTREELREIIADLLG
jgi:hypothetical protein